MKPEFYNYLNRREKQRDDPKRGVIFAIVEKGNILLERRLSGVANGLVIVPGGRRKVDEPKDLALIGELLEECGISPSRYEFLGDIKDIDIPNSDLEEAAIFLIREYEGIIENKEGKSVHLWSDIDNAKKVCSHALSLQILDMVEKSLMVEEAED